MVGDTVQLRVFQTKTHRVSELLQGALASFSWQCDHTTADTLSHRLASTAQESSMLLGSSLDFKNQRLLARTQLTTRSEVLLDPDAIVVVRRHDQHHLAN